MYKMVVIDDEYFTCEGLKLLLDWKSLDIEIVGFSLNGEEGLELVERVNPDIVMTDIKMKFMDGLTMIKKLRSKGFKGEIIVFSGYKVFEYAQDAMENGVSNYILKPVTKDKMLDAIKIVLDKLDSRRDANGGAAEDEGIYGSETDWSNVLKYIDSNITKDITLREAAAEACLETTYFSRLFKKKTGIGFSEYITRGRMELAKRLLSGTDLQIKEIMYHISYNDEKYFRKRFKSYTGYSPTKYRSIYKKDVKEM